MSDTESEFSGFSPSEIPDTDRLADLLDLSDVSLSSDDDSDDDDTPYPHDVVIEPADAAWTDDFTPPEVRAYILKNTYVLPNDMLDVLPIKKRYSIFIKHIMILNL